LSPKNLAKILAFFLKLLLVFPNIWSERWFLRKSPFFVGENWQK
jgi:hypothetical protein